MRQVTVTIDHQVADWIGRCATRRRDSVSNWIHGTAAVCVPALLAEAAHQRDVLGDCLERVRRSRGVRIHAWIDDDLYTRLCAFASGLDASPSAVLRCILAREHARLRVGHAVATSLSGNSPDN